MRMSLSLGACCALLFAQLGLAQQRGAQVWLDPAQGKLEPIRLRAADIEVHSYGFLSVTQVTLDFYNPNDRVLEGEFVFPLADGQSLVGYALEVRGQLREGVVVPKQTARVAFEEITRRGVDPGLAELTRGNVFRTRLYPLPARGSKRIALTIEQALVPSESGYRYLLPMAFSAPLERFNLRAEVLHSDSIPQSGPKSGLSFKRWQQNYRATLTRTNFLPTQALSFDLPRAVKQAIFSAADPLEPATLSFVAQVREPLARGQELAAPKKIALYYDASGSALAREREREFALLRAWLGSMGRVRVTLIAFRDVPEEPVQFQLELGATDALIKHLRELPLDGGSALGELNFAETDAEMIVLISDGISNFGARANALPPRPAARGVVLHAAQSADHEALKNLGTLLGGPVVNLLQSDQASALKLLSTPVQRLVSLRAVRGSCAHLAPSRGVLNSETWLLTGRCSGDASIEVVTASGATQRTQTLSLAGVAPLSDARGDTVHRLWARAQIAELERATKPDIAAITELATRYSVVTAHTSLLVLDEIADYLQYRVQPKEPALKAQYLAALRDLPKTPSDPGRAARLDQLAMQWQQFKQWHGTRFPWLETVLDPLLAKELDAWQQLLSAQPNAEAKRGFATASALRKQSAKLQARWSRDGADPQARLRWEREASELMLAAEALRNQRPELVVIAGEFDETEVSLSRSPPVASDAEPPGQVAEAAQESSPEPMTSSVAAAPPAPSARAGGDSGPGGNEQKSRMLAKAAAPLAQQAQIELTPWRANSPYLSKLRGAVDPYSTYLIEREQNANNPAFYLDCAEYFQSEFKNTYIAMRVLSNLAELQSESAPLTRVLAYRLRQWQRFELATPQFESALRMRGEEPQSYRDLALSLAASAKPERTRAVELLWQVATRNWSGRFPGIEIVALHELNEILSRPGKKPDLSKLDLDARFVAKLEVGLRVVLGWDADNVDIDLWVIDPNGETSIYSSPTTSTGGRLSNDFTQGYGPEVFVIQRPLPGTYRVVAHYYGNHQQALTGPITTQVEFQSNFGAGRAQSVLTSRRLEADKDELEIGRFTVQPIAQSAR